MSPSKRPLIRRRTALALLVCAALLAAPVALGAGTGTPVVGGARNPSSNQSQVYGSETQIIASNDTYGTRQSNKGSGGGAIYGCRSAPAGPPCVNATNLNTGAAFGFSSAGSLGGTITLKDTAGAPLTTNATGVAKGFNANYLQGKQASDFVARGQLDFAVVAAAGTLGANRGATSASAGSGNSYTVVFATPVNKCAYTASPVGAALNSGQIGVAADATNPNAVDVKAPSALPDGFDLQVTC